MATIQTRLSRLEEMAAVKGPGHGRLIRVVGGQRSDAEVDAFLHSEGINRRENDLLIFRALVRPSNNGPVPSDEPLRTVGAVGA